MRIALIAPPYPLEEAPSPPLGLCYVGAACEQAGAEVKIFDYIISQYTPFKLKAALDEFKPHIVGAASVTMNFQVAADIIKTAKLYHPHVITLMGGPHVSFDYQNVLKDYPEIDAIVIGESEQTLQEFIPFYNDKHQWKSICGLAFNNDGAIITTGKRSFIQDLDSLPKPARHLLMISKYKALGFPVSIITSRGCPNQCIFCQGRRMVGHKVRFRSTQKVVDEIEELIGMGMNMINIADDLFTANKRRVLAFCNELNNRKISLVWSAFSRVNTIDEEIVNAMKKAGCYAISFGIESGNQDILNCVKKGITLEQAKKATEICKQSGIRTHASFMVGLPGESMHTLEETYQFAQSLGIEYGYHFLSPFPGTTVRESIQDYDLTILSNDWSTYDANSAIVSTSCIDADTMNSFIAACQKPFQDEKDALVAKYDKGLCSPGEIFEVENFYRLIFNYNVLSKDLIENYVAPLNEKDPIQNLVNYLIPYVDIKPNLIDKFVHHLVNSSLLTYQLIDNHYKWEWVV